jgi:hypothetical protein
MMGKYLRQIWEAGEFCGFYPALPVGAGMGDDRQVGR